LFARLSTLGFVIVLTLAALRAYQYPAYCSDEFQYMANAVAMHGAHAPEIHATVYREVLAQVPGNILDHLLGKDAVDSPQSRSYQERASNPYSFAQFLPCFAVRPIFNEFVYVLHYWFGVGLLRATVLVPVLSYWLMGCVALLWISAYVPPVWATLCCALLMLTPPVWDLARWTTPDALSSLTLLLALYFILEKNWLTPGLTILLASIYVRTDNVLMAVLVLAYLSFLTKKIDKTKAAVLAAVAVASVPLINHFGGDYGPRMLYYRAFLGVPMAPGVMVAPPFGWHDYLVALRSGIAGAVHEAFIPFALMGVVGFVRRPSPAIAGLTVLAAAYAAGHFVLYPLPEDRFFGLFFGAMGISMASTVVAVRARSRQPLASVPVASSIPPAGLSA
jgi:hypothetical protein